MNNKKQNEIKDVAIKKLSAQNLENLFYIFEKEDGQYFYNILKTVNVPEDIAPNVYSQYEVVPKDTWPLIAYKFYKDVRLWWLVCSVNQIINPVKQPESGTIIKILKPYIVRNILSDIKES